MSRVYTVADVQAEVARLLGTLTDGVWSEVVELGLMSSLGSTWLAGQQGGGVEPWCRDSVSHYVRQVGGDGSVGEAWASAVYAAGGEHPGDGGLENFILALRAL